MARLYMAGAEILVGGTAAQNANPEGTINTGLVTRDTSVFRSGVASWKSDSGASVGASFIAPITPSTLFVSGTTYYARGYVRVAAAPAAASGVFGFCNLNAYLRTDGAIELRTQITPQGSPSAATITDSQWHRIEIKGVAAATTTWSSAELLLDGVSVATWSGSVSANANYTWGVMTPGTGTNFIVNVDDVCLNDSNGANNNTYPGDGAVVLLKPTADSAVGTGWVTGAGGSTSLFAAVSNTPPVGVADTGTATSQIRNATANATSYDATMTTYTAAGAGVGATVNAVLPVIATAAPVTTSSKQGTVGVVSNPAITNVALAATGTAGAFWAGLAAGTFGAGWKWSLGTMTEAPSVTLGTAPVMRVTNLTSSTRIADVCAMFMYVDYTPAAIPVLPIPNVVMAPYTHN